MHFHDRRARIKTIKASSNQGSSSKSVRLYDEQGCLPIAKLTQLTKKYQIAIEA
jgi:hypothetical protein